MGGGMASGFFFKSDHHQHHNIGVAVMFIFTGLYVTMWQNLLFLKFPLLTCNQKMLSKKIKNKIFIVLQETSESEDFINLASECLVWHQTACLVQVHLASMMND